MTHHLSKLSLTIALLFVVSACSSQSARSSSSWPTPVGSLVIEGPSAVETGTTTAFSVFVVNAADQSRRDVSLEAQWTSSNPAMLTIDRGSASAMLPGVATLEARFDQLKAAKVVGISAPLQPPGVPAKLDIESASVKVSGPDMNGWYGYSIRFRLKETGGESFADVGDITVVGPDGSEATGPSCWIENLRVPAGGTLDTFFTDEGTTSLSYCAPWYSGRTATPPALKLIVNFTGQTGGGSVETIISPSSAPETRQTAPSVRR